MKIEYDPITKKYLLDAKVTTKAKVISVLRAEGVTCRRTDLLLHLCKLAATVNGYFERWSESRNRNPSRSPTRGSAPRFAICLATPWIGKSVFAKPSDGSAQTFNRARRAKAFMV